MCIRDSLNIASFVVKSCTSVMEPHLVRMGLSERTVILPSFSRSRTKAENSFIIVQYNACHGNFILAVVTEELGQIAWRTLPASNSLWPPRKHVAVKHHEHRHRAKKDTFSASSDKAFISLLMKKRYFEFFTVMPVCSYLTDSLNALVVTCTIYRPTLYQHVMCWCHTDHCSWWFVLHLSLIHIWRCRRSYACRSRWSPYH